MSTERCNITEHEEEVDKKFVQGTVEWLTYRKEKLGATDYTILMKESKYKTPYQLYNEKTSEEIEEDKGKAFLFQQAHAVQEHAHEALSVYFKEKYDSFLELSSNPEECEASAEKFAKPTIDGFHIALYTRASLDYLLKLGRYKTGIPVEVKYNNEKNHDDVLLGKITRGHLIQVQIQMYCVGSNFAYYASYNPKAGDEALSVVRVNRDDDLIKECLQQGENFLRNHMIPRISPEPDEKRATSRFLELERMYQALDAQKKHTEEEIAMLRKDIEKEAGDDNMFGKIYRIKHSYRKGNVDTDMIKKQFKIDLDAYRKSGKWSTTMTRL